MQASTGLERALLATALLAGSAWRLADVGPALLFGDELHSLRDMHGGLAAVLTTFSDTGSGLALPLLQLSSIEAFGPGHWAIRAPAWLPALATLFLVQPIARAWLGGTAALVATLLFAVNPLAIFYAHFGRAYSLVALLSLLLLDRLMRCVAEPREPTASRLAQLVALTALLPWAHPTALGFVGPVYAGAIAALALRSGGGRSALRLTAALAGGGLLCLLLHLPAWSSLREFVSAKTTAEYYGDFGLLDVAALVAGSRPAALVGLAAAATAGGLWLRERGAAGLPLVLACVGPGLVIGLVRPYGDAYAYARYVMPAVAPLCLLLAAGAALGVRRWRFSTALLTLLGVTASGLLLLGRGAPGLPGSGPHANTYLTLFPLPAFDRPWPGTPPFYRMLAERHESGSGPLRLIESPALTNRTRHLYRNYYLQHGAETWLAPLPGEFPRMPDGPYVSPLDAGWRSRAQADYLVLHLDVAREVVRYWGWLYGEHPPQPPDPDGAACMERHRRFGGPLPALPPGLLARLEAELGAPFYRDADIAVWQLRAPRRD